MTAVIVHSHLQKFRFKTRLQRLNNIEASCRAKLNFLEQLYQFHRQQGNPRVAVPTINHKPLDLWLLRKEVQKLGGYQAVCYYVCLRSSHAQLLWELGGRGKQMGGFGTGARLHGDSGTFGSNQELIHPSHPAVRGFL